MSFKSNISKILTSSILLRTIFVLSFFNIIGYLVYGNFHAVIFFLLVAGLVKYFSRNMILILLRQRAVKEEKVKKKEVVVEKEKVLKEENKIH